MTKPYPEGWTTILTPDEELHMLCRPFQGPVQEEHFGKFLVVNVRTAEHWLAESEEIAMAKVHDVAQSLPMDSNSMIGYMRISANPSLPGFSR